MILEIIGFIFIILIGSLSHFVYEWSNHNKIVAIFTSVNESVWEHIKLALTPSFLWLIIEIPFLYKNPNFIFAKLVGISSMIILIPLLYYGYKRVLKQEKLWLDILVFILSVFLGSVLTILVLVSNEVSFVVNYFSIVALIVIFICYLLFTLLPPNLFLFTDPKTKKTGIKGHSD